MALTDTPLRHSSEVPACAGTHVASPDRLGLKQQPELAALGIVTHAAAVAVEALAAAYRPQETDPVLLHQAELIVQHIQVLRLSIETYHRIASTIAPRPTTATKF